uniref:Uncharacterized protein n=1 Tax=Haplochromis burtoni TaxID=8153 RepID=A0A3Q2WHA6_HAPBU
MNVFDHSETDALFQFSHISHSTLEHVKNVYSSLAICMCLAAVGSYVYIYLVALLVTVSAGSCTASNTPLSKSTTCWVLQKSLRLLSSLPLLRECDLGFTACTEVKG